MKQSLELRQNQKLTMTPQLQQAIKLLQMSATELTEELQQAHEINPLLEIMEEESEYQSLSVEAEESDVNKERDTPQFDQTSEEIHLDQDAQEFVSSSFSGISGGEAYKYGGTDEQLVVPEEAPTLRETLASQAIYLFEKENDRRIAHHIIQNINEAGYIDVPLEDIADSLAMRSSVPMSEIEAVLKTLQKLDPVGVCARNPRECLMLQINVLQSDSPGYAVAKSIIESYLGLLAEKDFRELRKVLHVSESELEYAISLIQGLNPHPGYSVGSSSIDYIVPDILVEKKKGNWFARLNPSALPKLSIHEGYQKMITQGGAGEYSELKEQLQRAKWLMSNIEKRHKTILSVAREIVERQQEFFHFGSGKMQPLTLSQIAEPLGVHESTVSRATTGKYLSAPQGNYELKYFFSSGVRDSDGSSISSLAIQSEIKRIIDTERPAKPISDENIRILLADIGVKVARRTVAKYREQMGIPGSSKRKSMTRLN